MTDYAIADNANLMTRNADDRVTHNEFADVQA